MLKQAFANFANRTNEEPENDAERDEPLDGNTFSGSSAKKSREGEILLQAGYMSGEGNSALSFVNSRLRALFSSEASPENKQKAMDARLHAQMMMQQQMQRFRQALEEMDRALAAQIAMLEAQKEQAQRFRDIFISGQYDPSNEDHRAGAVAAGLDPDKVQDMALSDVLEVTDKTISDLGDRIIEVQDFQAQANTLFEQIMEGKQSGNYDFINDPAFQRDENGLYINLILRDAEEGLGANAGQMEPGEYWENMLVSIRFITNENVIDVNLDIEEVSPLTEVQTFSFS
jgi:hypothetical protein